MGAISIQQTGACAEGREDVPLEFVGGEIWGAWLSHAHISVQVSVRA